MSEHHSVARGPAQGFWPIRPLVAGENTDWQQPEAEPPAPSAHSREAQVSLTAAPSAPAPWTSPDEAPSWANPEGAASCQSLHPALSPSPALRMGLLLAPRVFPDDPCLFCSISG